MKFKSTQKKIVKGDGVDYFIEAKGVEIFLTTHQRAGSIFKKIEDECLNKNVLIVTHGDIGKMIVAVYRDLGWAEGLKITYIKNTEVIKLF